MTIPCLVTYTIEWHEDSSESKLITISTFCHGIVTCVCANGATKNYLWCSPSRAKKELKWCTLNLCCCGYNVRQMPNENKQHMNMSTVELQMRLKCNYVQRFLSTHTHIHSQFKSFENVSFEWKQWECDSTMNAHRARSFSHHFRLQEIRIVFQLFYLLLKISNIIIYSWCFLCSFCSPRVYHVEYWIFVSILTVCSHRYQSHEMKTICKRKSIDRKIDINSF